MKNFPIDDGTTPIACTATDDELSERVEVIERMHAALLGVDRTEHGLVLHFPQRPDLEADVRRFTVEEKRCCQFWGFDIEAANGQLHLRWDGPPAVQELMDRLQGHLEGDEPITALDGLF
jgi:hypothetical protein